jgi:hypothetical protein
MPITRSFFTVRGKGVVAAVGSSNPVSEEPYRGNQRSVYEGRCLVAVKTTGTPGTITLSPQADGLDPAKTTTPAVGARHSREDDLSSRRLRPRGTADLHLDAGNASPLPQRISIARSE